MCDDNNCLTSKVYYLTSISFMQNQSAISKLNLVQSFVDDGNGMLPSHEDFLEVLMDLGPL